jgi:hypothetical protein
MPQELKKVNGRWQLVGDDHSQDHVPPPPTPGPKPKAKAKAKPKAKAAEKPWWHPIVNELRYAGKQISSLQGTQKPGTSQPPWKDPLQVVLERVIPEARLISNIQGSSPVLRQVNAASSFGAFQTAGEGLIALGQKILAPGKYADARRSPPGRALNAIARAGYEMLGAKQPEDLTEGQRGVIDNMGRMAGIEAATLPIGGAVGRRVAVGGTSWAARGLRYGTALGVTHGMGALLQDSTQGNISNMVGALTGVDGVPLSVDPTKDDRVTAAVKSLIPNIIGGELLGLAGSAGVRAVGKGVSAARRGIEALPSRPPSPPAGSLDPPPKRGATWYGRRRPPERNVIAVPEPSELQDYLGRRGFDGSNPDLSPMDASPVQYALGMMEQGDALRGSGKGFQNIRRYQRAAGANTAHTTAGEKLKARGLVEDIDGQQRFTEQALEKPAPVPIPQTPNEARDAVLARWGRGWQQQPVTAPVEPPAPAPREDGPAYQEWLRKNASTAIVPVRPVESAPVATLPRQPLAPRDELRGEGLADPWGMGPDPSSPAQQWLGARTGARQEPPALAVKDSLTAPAAAAEEVAPLDPSSYDPALPEVADAQKLVSQLDPAELQALAVVGADGGPALQHIEEVIASRPAPQPRPEISEGWAGIPTDKLSDMYLNGAGDLQPWSAQLDRLPATTLEELSHPDASPALAQRIADDTGKEWPFSREEVINGMQGLSADGTTIVPNRLRGDIRTMRTEDIYAAPQEFQYKEGVNAQGEQLGQSLGGVERWDPNAEGVLEVFTDPRDGRTKVVNGHNRRALAGRLGVPTLRVEEVNATTPAGARAAGAISNISAGNGTPFDAAKFIRSTGLTDQAQLQAAGIPLDKGWGRQGLALSKLPQDIFHDAVNGEQRLGRYVALGESGLDEPGMRGAYQVLKQRPKMTEDTFREVLDQAKQQGNVVAPSAQGGLFGDEVLNPMLQRAELVADVRSGLAKDRRLFGFATRNADALSEAGATTIDTAAAGQRVADAQQALGLFDTLKNASGPVGELLSRGAERIAQGENASIVAKQIQREIGDSIERELANSGMKATPQELASIPPELPVIDAAGPARRRRRGTPISDALGADLNALGGTLANHVRGLDGYLQGQANRIEARQQALAAEAADVMAELPGIDRATLEAHAVQRLIANGEVRPTEMQPLGLPQAPSADIRAVRRELAAMDPALPLEDQLPNMPATRQAAADELRLAAEYARQDAEIARAAETAAREAEGYDLLSLQEKKAQGLGAEWVATESADEIFAEIDEILADMGDRGRRLAREGQMALNEAAGLVDQDMLQGPDKIVQGPRAAGSVTPEVMDTTVMPPEPPAPRFRRIADTLLPPGYELYHGTTSAGRKGIMASGFRASIAEGTGTVLGEGAYFTGNEHYASVYGDKLVWGELPSEAKILDLASQEKTVADLADEAGVTGPRETYRGDVRLSFEQQQQVKDWAVANGYSGIRFRSFDTPGNPQLETVFYDLELASKMVGARITPEVMDTTVMPPEPPAPRPRRIADTLRATLRTLAESDARLYRAIGETVGEASGAPQFTLPPDLAKASPRYGRNTLKFESDLDRAAYVLANDKAKGGSKSANKFRNELIAAGFDPDQVAAHGKTVKEAVKAAARDISGEVVVPVQDFAAGRPRLPLPEQQRQIEGTKAQIDDLQQKLNEGGCGT